MKIKNEFIVPKIEKLEPANDIKRPIQFQFQSAIPMHAWICMQTESVFNRTVFSCHTFTSTQWKKGGKESGQTERLTKNAIGVFHFSKNPSRTQLISVFVLGYACAVRSVLISNQFVDSLFLFRASASLCSVLLFWYVWASGFFLFLLPLTLCVSKLVLRHFQFTSYALHDFSLFVAPSLHRVKPIFHFFLPLLKCEQNQMDLVWAQQSIRMLFYFGCLRVR